MQKVALADSVILIVDDEIGVTRLTQRLLERAGYSVITANRPQDGVRYLENHPIHLMLVDIRMPEMDGFQLMSIARSIQPEIAVVIMTGYGTVDTAVESLRKGADGMVLKPFTGADLVQSIEQALRAKNSQREIQRLRFLRPLFDITEALISETDPTQLQNLITAIGREQFKCSHLSIYWQGSDGFDCISAHGLPLRHPVNKILEAALVSNEPILLQAGKQPDTPIETVLSENGLGSVICVPTLNGAGFHAMIAGRAVRQLPFSTTDFEMLILFSRQSTIALENAQLYTDLQAHVTQIETSQQALMQAEKMAAVGRLTASIAHEINNPLQSVRNCLHIIQNGNLDQNALADYLELVNEELDRLMSAAKRMLDFYRPGVLQRHPADIDTVIIDAVDLIKKQLTRQGIAIHRVSQPNLPQIMAVSNQIQQAIFNIVLNAMEAMPRGGQLHIGAQAVDGHVIIRVDDSGPGIPAAIHENLFEPFVSTKEDGLGLGLTVSYGIITAHGGTIELIPSVLGGACFQLSLPVGD